MITADETLRVRKIRKMAEDGESGSVSTEDRQWILDLHKRENIPLPEDVYLNAKAAGFDVEGIKVKDND